MITKEDIAAMRTAETLSFHHTDGKSKIIASVRVENGPFTGDMQRIIPCEFGQGFPSCWSMGNADQFNAYYHLHFPQSDNAWQTIVRHLKPGKTLRLLWSASNNSQVLDQAGLHLDTLFLMVSDKENDRDSIDLYSVGVSVCANNTARMIRPKY